MAGGVVIILGAMAVAVLVSMRPAEPEHEGKPLSAWLAGYDTPPHGAEYERTDEAVRQMGTRAIPVLLKMVAATDSPVKLKLVSLAGRQHFVRIGFVPATWRNQKGALGFHALGRQARAAVPALIQIYKSQGSLESAIAAAEALEAMGPPASEAVPALLGGLTDHDSRMRRTAANALGSIQSAPEKVVPALVVCLRDSDLDVAVNAAWSLGLFGARAAPAVPALLEALAGWQPGEGSKGVLIVVLGEIHSRPELAVPALVEEFHDPSVFVRCMAAHSLGSFGAGARSAIPALVKLSGDPDAAVRGEARGALKQIDPQAAEEPPAN